MLDFLQTVLALGAGFIMALTAAYTVVYLWEAFCKWARIV